MVTLFIVCLIGFFLFAYLYLVRTQRGNVARSQAWNGALAMAEAGVEEALAQLNPGVYLAPVDRTANGWGAPNNGIYGPASRSVPDYGSYSVVYTADTNPIIYSTGYVSVASIPATLTRVVRVTTVNGNLFRGALTTKYNLDLKGSNIGTDSFNSMIGTLSTGGMYDPTKTSTNGDIASVQGIVNVGNDIVNGCVLLGPTASASPLKASGVITGGVTNDLNIEIPDVVLPTATPLPVSPLATPVVTNGVSYDYAFFNSGYYTIDKLQSSDSIYVAPNTTVTLLLTGSASANTIYVAPAAAGIASGNLTVYMDGPTFSLSGGQGVDSGNPLNFSYYGTTNNTAINFSGNCTFTGTIYAPEAALSMTGGGTVAYDFVGAAVVASASVSGHFQFHYDENLTQNGPRGGFVPTSWTEL